jgi:hypothetical protein
LKPNGPPNKPGERSGSPPPPPPGPEEKGGPLPKKKACDEFYGAWDRFTLQKERVMRRSDKDRRAVKKEAKEEGGDGKSEGSSRSSSANQKAADKQGPSLDTDIEGRPAHPVSVNKEGVQSR